MTDTHPISCCFDEESSKMLKEYRKKGLSITARPILASLTKKGLAGATTLELGCGIGALSVELLKGGAKSAVGIDLSPKMVSAARSLAAEAGLAESSSFEIGDGATANLTKSNIVILDSMLCCYPDLDSMLENSSSAALSYYAIAIPDDRRPFVKFLKIFLPLQALFLRGGFRFFVHPSRKILRYLQEKGFKVVYEETAGWVWSVIVFAAPGTS